MSTRAERGFRLTPPRPFDLSTALRGHGWVSLPPHRFDPETRTLHTVLVCGSQAVDVTLVQRGARVHGSLHGRHRISDGDVARARRMVSHALRLDEELERFWSLCRRQPRLCWVARRGAGRLQRSPTVFEDLLKLLFTTNCSWQATLGMTRRLVDSLGRPAPSGTRSFPGAERCAQGPGFYREVVRAGYRAEACAELAEAFASGALTDADFLDPDLPTDELRRRLLSLRGFGPYAAGQALRLLGRYDDLALDSWCRSKLAEITGRRQPPAERTLMRRYAPFGEYRGLALWMDLTADWHGERT